ncbi:conserved hypothetical protein [Sporisorium reilianum SRZ2]|uniref:Pentacotripeptide-repeat region of PRORP domain-containing protein n=1 Tax=Sporisorium reilianum (strain SRZ2) TaxID=999809 RepID=E6ZTH7_SPORE|nr:conserved hypothetical protein [Sporisorium reilianum SRZ2]
MRPPPAAALVRARASQRQGLLELLTLANRICLLAADINRIDRISRRAHIVRPVGSRTSAGSSDLPKTPSSLCDFPCPSGGASDPARANKTIYPRGRSRQHLPQQHQKLSVSLRSSPQTQPARPQNQSRYASTAAATNGTSNSHADQHDTPLPFSHDPSSSPTQHQWQQSVDDPTSPASPSPAKSASDPHHWLSPWKPARKKSTREDAQMRADIDKALAEQRAEFAPGWQQRTEVFGIHLRRLAAHRLWRLYQTHAHKQTLPVATRVVIAQLLAMSAHYTTTNKVELPTSKALRHLLGRRIQAILQDCHIVRSRSRSAASSKAPSTLMHSDLTIALLEPISVALQAQPNRALKIMDKVLLDCRPDIYRYKTDASMRNDYLSPIHTTLLTIADSIDFEINCQPSAKVLSNAIRLQPGFFEDGGMLADLERGLEMQVESRDPIKDTLDWIIDSPHAFLLSHKAFRNARTALFHCLSQAKDAHRILEALSSDRDSEQPGFVFACEIFLRSLLRKSKEAALEFYDDLWSRGVNLPHRLINRMIRETGGQAPAARLEVLLHRVNNLKSEGQGRASIALLRNVTLSWAMRNRADRVTALLAQLKRRSSKGHDEFARRVMAELAAARGDVQTLHTRLAEQFDFEARHTDDCAEGKIPLNGKAYGLLIKSCNRSDDVDLAEFYLTQALERGITPRSSDFNLIIDMHVRKTNIDAALAVFDQMKDFGLQPDTYTYTILIHGFALRRDPDSAAHALRAMIAAGKSPDRITYAALLNCFVESGLYESAIRLFAWMQNQRDSRVRPTIEVCNIILKAYVLSSLPVQKVMKFVDTVRKLGLVPNASTYALMLQSACDAGLMDVAEEVFSEAESALPDLTGSGSRHGANIYHFTIMIHGYLRLGDHQEAKDYFDEMQGRKLTPSAITWSVMVHSYAHSENEANYDLACNLVSQLVTDETKRIFRPSSWDVPATRAQLAKVQKADHGGDGAGGGVGYRLAAKHSAPFENLYTVLMVAQARRGEPDKVEQTLKTMARRMPNLSVPALTPLLDAYRRAGDIDSALALFDQIYDSALQAAHSNSRRVYAYSATDEDGQPAQDAPAPQAPERRQDASSRSTLCLPISIMIDLLSTAGRHDEVAKIWSRAKNDGFGFDSDNWNHLVASMARAGQLDEALSVVEHVLYRDPPNAWMRSRLGVGRGDTAEDKAEVEAHVDRLVQERDDVGAEELDDEEDFDPLPLDTLLDPAATHRSDATAVSASPPNRRHQGRADDDPFVDLPFDRPTTSTHRSEDDPDFDEATPPAPAEEYTAPGAFYLSRDAKLPIRRDLSSNRDTSFSPWYAHFVTMEAISRGLADMREPSHVIRLLDKYRSAAGLLDLHERKVEIIRERQREEAVRSARDLIDGRG